MLPKGNLASRARRQPTSQGNHAASSSLLGKLREAKRLQEKTARTGRVNSLSRSASSELCRDAAVSRPVNPKPGPTHHTPVAHWPRSSPEGARGTPESPTCSRRMENTYPGDDQRLVEVYAPRESEAPGRRPGQDHVLGHGASWHCLARAGPQRVSPSGTAHSAPGAVSSLDRDPGALSPLACDVTGLPSSPPPPTKESSNFGRKRRARPAGVYRRAPARRSLPDFLGLRLEEASGYNSHPSLKVTPVLLFIFCLESRRELHWKLKAIKPQPLYLKLKEDKHHQCNWLLSNFEISNSCLLVCEPG